jgi:hypothetical protein
MVEDEKEPQSKSLSSESLEPLHRWRTATWLVAIFPTPNPKKKADLHLVQGAATRLERNPKHGPDYVRWEGDVTSQPVAVTSQGSPGRARY